MRKGCRQRVLCDVEHHLAASQAQAVCVCDAVGRPIVAAARDARTRCFAASPGGCSLLPAGPPFSRPQHRPPAVRPSAGHQPHQQQPAYPPPLAKKAAAAAAPGLASPNTPNQPTPPPKGPLLPHGRQRGVLVRGEEDRGAHGELPARDRCVLAGGLACTAAGSHGLGRGSHGWIARGRSGSHPAAIVITFIIISMYLQACASRRTRRFTRGRSRS